MADETQTQFLALTQIAERLLQGLTAIATTQDFHSRILQSVLAALTAPPSDVDELGLLIQSLTRSIAANTDKVADLVVALDVLPDRVGAEVAARTKTAFLV